MTTDDKGTLALRPATDADRPQVHSWLRRPEIRRWWGSLAAAEAEILIATETPSSIRRMVTLAGRAVGYGQAVDADLTGDGEMLSLAPATWDVSLFIAVPELRGKGLGLAALELLSDEVFSTTLALALSVVVSVRNEAAVRIYEKAGFRWHRVLDDPLFGPSWLMLKQR
jgi:aminoglycoside 6'-N-acetyltransferase